jgi:hypothetical protein
MATRHKWQYKDGQFPRKCAKCGVKEVLKSRPSKKGPGKVDQIYHQLPGTKDLILGQAPPCTSE